jgi:YesN/AraC family two-component response regulator
MFLSKGFNSFLSKPIDVMRLDAILRQFVRDKQSEETRAAAEKAAEEATALAAKNALFEQEDPNAAAAKVLSTVFVENIDIKKGVAHFGGENTYLTILRSYFQHTPKLLEKMSAPAPDTLKEYAVTVHGLKSASYGIFAHEVGRQAEALEMLAKAGDYESVSVKNPAFLKAASELLTTIDEILRAISYLTNEGCKEKADSIDTHLLDALLNAAEHFKSAELERTMGALERYSYKEKSDNELISWLREQINNLEYDAVREKLKTLAGGAA